MLSIDTYNTEWYNWKNKEMRGRYNEKVVIMYRNSSFDGEFSRV